MIFHSGNEGGEQMTVADIKMRSVHFLERFKFPDGIIPDQGD